MEILREATTDSIRRDPLGLERPSRYKQDHNNVIQNKVKILIQLNVQSVAQMQYYVGINHI